MLQQLSCIKVKHILKDYFLNYYFLGFYKYILQYCFEDFPLKMYTLSVISQGVRDTTWISTKWTLSLLERCSFTDYSVLSIKIDR